MEASNIGEISSVGAFPGAAAGCGGPKRAGLSCDGRKLPVSANGLSCDQGQNVPCWKNCAAIRQPVQQWYIFKGGAGVADFVSVDNRGVRSYISSAFQEYDRGKRNTVSGKIMRQTIPEPMAASTSQGRGKNWVFLAQ
ncbi:hypothetical protein [Devosia sp.]|uniref:hypothetical protein n=1 Tax=Devosia sp. TaxID=1871048 RepID=UPI0032657A59